MVTWRLTDSNTCIYYLYTMRLLRFAPLIDHLVDGRANLTGVFWCDSETQTCLSYDPESDFALFNGAMRLHTRPILDRPATDMLGSTGVCWLGLCTFKTEGCFYERTEENHTKVPAENLLSRGMDARRRHGPNTTHHQAGAILP